MGMFDHVICNYPLGDDKLPKTGWQTKDLDCYLETYTIHEDGRLTKPWVDPDGDPDDPPSVVKDEFQDYTGEVVFYTYLGKTYEDRVAFRARFDHGAVVEMTQIEPEHKAINVDTLSAAQQRMALKDGLDHLLKKDTMAVKWLIWGHSREVHPDKWPVYVEVREGPKGRKYAVTRGSAVLAKDGAWEYEPTPSSRTDEFIERTRFNSFDEAFNHFNKVNADIGGCLHEASSSARKEKT